MHRRPVVDNRRQVRKRMLKGGTIAFNGRHSTMPCVVRDISDTGARLQVSQANAVPDTFELLIDLDGFEAPVQIAWRDLSEVGVQFTAPPVWVTPKRAQTVTMTVPVEARGKISLRRPEVRTPSIQPAPQQTSQQTSHQTPRPTAQPAETGSTPLAPQTPVQVSAPPVAPYPSPKADPRRQIPIVIADDDEDDRLLIEDAFRDSNFAHPFAFVENGEELLKYLKGVAPYEDRPLPGLILLDLNMPRMDGRTALMHMKHDAKLRSIPVIVLTTSNGEDDIHRTYDLGISAYIPKPSTYNGLIELVDALNNYWLRFVSLPVRA